MSSWRLSALGASGRANQKLRGALLPVPPGQAMGFQARGVIMGSPGTTQIPAPAPFCKTDESLVAQAQTGIIGEPSTKFSWWLPGVYYSPSVWKPHVSYFSDNQMPVPAIDPRGLPGVVMPGPVMIGQKQVLQPRVAPKYANRRASRG